MRWWGWLGLIVLYCVRIDLWFWDDSSRILGFPVGLAYHIGFCFAVTAFFFLVVKNMWPRELDAVEQESGT